MSSRKFIDHQRTEMVVCPFCEQEHDSDDIWDGSDVYCASCKRRYRIEVETLYTTMKYCDRFDGCRWESTISPDYEKCPVCLDVRKAAVRNPPDPQPRCDSR
jgi:hypothetical protein